MSLLQPCEHLQDAKNVLQAIHSISIALSHFFLLYDGLTIAKHQYCFCISRGKFNISTIRTLNSGKVLRFFYTISHILSQLILLVEYQLGWYMILPNIDIDIEMGPGQISILILILYKNKKLSQILILIMILKWDSGGEMRSTLIHYLW